MNEIRRTGTGEAGLIQTLMNHGPAAKLSFLLMGTVNIVNQQLLKGILYLAAEIVFLLWLVRYGIRNLAGLITLGVREQDWVFDESMGINIQVSGDNSMLMLIYGLATVIVIVLFVLFYITSLIQQFIGNINNFNVIYLLTEGGPLNSSYYVAGETDLLVT